MPPTAWLRLTHRRGRHGRQYRYSRYFRPVLEALEGRVLLSSVFTIPVLSTSDTPAYAPTVTFAQLQANGFANVTLRDALTAANNSGGGNVNAVYVVQLQPTTYDLNQVDNFWYGPNALPAIASNVVIAGNGATLDRTATDPMRFFFVAGNTSLNPGLTPGSLQLFGLTLENGLAQGGNSNLGGGGLGAGGAIFNAGQLSLTGVTLLDNSAVGGNGGDATAGNGGGGMGAGSSPITNSGGGFGPSFSTAQSAAGGLGGNAVGGGGGVGLGNTAGSSGSTFSGGFGGEGTTAPFDYAFAFGGNGANPNGSGTGFGGNGGGFGQGGATGTFGGGGGVGGGGGSDTVFSSSFVFVQGGFGGFGGGGGGAVGGQAGFGGFGGGGGGVTIDGQIGFGGFGGGDGAFGAGGGGAGMGGAIFNLLGTVVLTNSTLTGNTAQGGSSLGAIALAGQGYGGGIFNLNGGVMLHDDTLAFNNALAGSGAPPGPDAFFFPSDGGAVYNLASGGDEKTTGHAVVQLTNSILADSNAGQPAIADLADTSSNSVVNPTAFINGTTNLVMSFAEYGAEITPPSGGSGLQPGVITVTADPQLPPLANNGGPTPTMALGLASPAAGAGNIAALQLLVTTHQFPVNASGQPIDQREQLRIDPVRGVLDLGAFEFQEPVPTTTTANSVTVPFSSSSQTVTLQATVTDSIALAIAEGQVQLSLTVLDAHGVATPITVTALADPAHPGIFTATLTLPPGAQPGNYSVSATFTDPGGRFESSSGTGSLTVTPPPAPPPTPPPPVSTPTPPVVTTPPTLPTISVPPFLPLPLPVLQDITAVPNVGAATTVSPTTSPSPFTLTAFDLVRVATLTLPLSGGGNTPSEGTALNVDPVLSTPLHQGAGALSSQSEGRPQLSGMEIGGSLDPVTTKALRLGSSLTEADDSVGLVQVVIGSNHTAAPAATPPAISPASSPSGTRRGALAPTHRPTAIQSALLWPWVTFLAAFGAWIGLPLASRKRQPPGD